MGRVTKSDGNQRQVRYLVGVLYKIKIQIRYPFRKFTFVACQKTS
jgi:hypothetical protein